MPVGLCVCVCLEGRGVCVCGECVGGGVCRVEWQRRHSSNTQRVETARNDMCLLVFGSTQGWAEC